MSNPKSRIKKGKDLEDHVAQKLIDYGIDKHADRQIGSGSGKRKGDVRNYCGWTIECKNTKSFQWKKAADQVRRQAMGYEKEVIIWHPPQRPLDDSVAIISLHDFLDLIKFQADHKGRTDILDKYQIKTNLERAVYHLKQVIKEL